MQVYTQLLTFGASAVQLTGTNPLACKIYAEPLLSNTHTSYVGTSTVTNDGSGTGVIQELPKGGQVSQQMPNHFCFGCGGLNKIDTTQFYFHGTAGEKMKVTYYIA
jgi:hypothetical protein